MNIFTEYLLSSVTTSELDLFLNKLFENVSDSRIQHLEDLIFWEGSAGAKRALNTINDIQKGDSQKITIKWDGSPAIVFGRRPDGKFILTDKNGFVAKGYDGRATSGEALEQMFLARGSTKTENYISFAKNMKNIFPIFESAVSNNQRGYFQGDLLYFSQPKVVDNRFVFKPNTVTYSVDIDSDLGIKISKSKCGVVLHGEIDLSGSPSPLTNLDKIKGPHLLAIPPVYIDKRNIKIDNSLLQQTIGIVNRYGNDIDKMLDKNELTKLKLSDFPNVLYAYVNSKVDSGLKHLGKDFGKWIQSNSKISGNKKINILNYIKSNRQSFEPLWEIVTNIITLKDKAIDDLESMNTSIQSSIDGQPGGEGYVVSDPSGKIKMVSRSRFSSANRLSHKKEPIGEGGNMFDDVTPFNKSEFSTILSTVQNKMPGKIKIHSIGSAGFKDQSGDLDILVEENEILKIFNTTDVKIAKNKLKDHFKNIGWDSVLSGISVHVRVPIKNRFVQVDIMLVNNAESVSRYHKHDYANTKFTGFHKQVVLSSLAKYTKTSNHPDGFIWSAFQGLKDRTTKQLVLTDIDEIAKLLISPDANAHDMRSIESILDKLSPKNKETKLKDAKETLSKDGIFI